MHVFKTGMDPKEACGLCGITVGASRYFGWWTSCPGKVRFGRLPRKEGEKYGYMPIYMELKWGREVSHAKSHKVGICRGGIYKYDDNTGEVSGGWVIVDWGNDMTCEHLYNVIPRCT